MHLRAYLNEHFKLKAIVNSDVYKFFNSAMILTAFCNAIYFLYSKNVVASKVDNSFANLFLIEIIIKLLAIGPENCFSELFGTADFLMVISGFVLQFMTSLTNQDALLRMFRLYKASFLLEIMLKNRFWSYELVIYKDLRNLFLRMTVMIPIIMKFVPLFSYVFYIFGVVGMEVFYNSEKMDLTDYTGYEGYREYSNFKTFLATQFYLVQVMTEAGWSTVAFDYADRSKEYFGPIMTLFAFFHVMIVLVMATLMKGIIWSAFIAVSGQYEENKEAEDI